MVPKKTWLRVSLISALGEPSILTSTSAGDAGFLALPEVPQPLCGASGTISLSNSARDVPASPAEVLARPPKVLASGGELVASRRESRKPARPPATTPEGRENQLIAAAVDLAEKQIREGSASAAVLTHYLKLATTREKLEQERLRGENELLKAKVENLASLGRVEELYKNALEAMRSYAGHGAQDEIEDQVLHGAQSA